MGKIIFILGIFLLFILLIIGYFFWKNKSNHGIPIKTPLATTKNNSIIDPNLAKMSLREKIISLMILHTPGTSPQNFSRFISTYHPAGVILMGDNIPKNPSDLKNITAEIQQASSPYPTFIATDEEGCSVKRIPTDNFPCASELKGKSTDETFTAFQNRSVMLHSLGINLNFGIIADITNNQNSFIYPRVFGSDPNKVAAHVDAALHASSPYVFSTLKHFPGHGETTSDSHITVPIVDISKSDWEKKDAIPFQAGVDADTEFIMFAHINYQQIDNKPATLSPIWHNILTKEMGYKNIIVTDDMLMLQMSGKEQYQNAGQNAIDAINAGNNILLYVNDYNLIDEPIRHLNIDSLVSSIETAVQSGEISEQTIDDDVNKVLLMRKKCAERNICSID